MAMTQTEQTLADQLRAARALIDTPEKWIRNAWARTSTRGRLALSWADSRAKCFCVGGAIRRSDGRRWPLAEVVLRDAITTGHSTIYGLNDDPTTTHADVMALFDRAIAKAVSL